MRRTSRASLQRLAVWACAGAFAALLTGCGATPAARVVDSCILEPNSSCVQSHLAGQDLAGLNLRGTDFSLSDIRDSNLAGTNFAGANLYLADLTGAKVSGANFASANLIGAICPNGTLAGGPSGAPPTCADLPINHSLGAP